MKKSNLYTATGDKGTTSLVGGKRVSKSDVRLEAYGTTDELNAHIGLLVAMISEGDDKALLRRIQDNLFVVGSALATDLSSTQLYDASKLDVAEISLVERRIDALDAIVPPLCKFVLPGGDKAAAQAHVCRTVCRRAERRAIEVSENYEINHLLLVLLNRLSDYLYALCRTITERLGAEEVLWQS